MNIKPILNLNRHPRDCEDYSLINAENVKLTLDQSALVTEESIKKNNVIKKTIDDYYGDNAIDSTGEPAWKIISCIPCSDELVLFVYNKIITPDTGIMRAIIIRYNVVNKTIVITYTKNGGIVISSPNTTIKGTFTYNVENSLILAIAEYDGDDKNIPLKTINLGVFNQIDDKDIYSDLDTKDELLACSPEIYLPNISNIANTKGSTYKGWYYFFIRIKINKIDYTQWYSFGCPIFIDSIDEVNIIKYGFNQNINADGLGPSDDSVQFTFPNYKPTGFVTGCSDNISNSSDIATTTIKFNIDFNNKIKDLYGENFIYQIAFTCSSKSYTKSYKSFDIINSNSNIFIINPKDLAEVSVNELITDTYNYFNVKTITNYKNKLYISNYKENNINHKIEEAVKNIEASIHYSGLIANTDTKKSIALIDISSPGASSGDPNLDSSQFFANNKQSFQFDSINNTYSDVITLDNFLKVDPNTKIKVNDKIAAAKTFYIERTYNGNRYDNVCNPIHLSGALHVNNGIINITVNQNTIQLNLDNYYMITPIPYTNTKNSFEDRCNSYSLIPGEVYNFFIHFIDKYGQISNGYRIPNNTKITDYQGNEQYPIKFSIANKIYYAGVPVRQKMIYGNKGNGYTVDISNMNIYNTFSERYLTNLVTDPTELSACKDEFVKQFSIFCNDAYIDYEWWQIINIPSNGIFNYYYNNNNEKLFRVPNAKEDNTIHYGYYPVFTDIVIPEDSGYIGYCISYEKFEPIRQITGVLTNCDFRINHYRSDRTEWKETYSDVVFQPLNSRYSNKMRFYSSLLDISDKLKFDYSVMELKPSSFSVDKYWLYWQQFPFFSYPKDLNKTNGDAKYIAATSEIVYPMPKYKLSVANSAQDDRMGVGTCIEMDAAYGLFNQITDNDTVNPTNYSMFIATLINPTKDIYMNKEKILIRCGDFMYPKKLSDSTIAVRTGLNGKITYDGVIIYDGHGVSFNEATTKIYGLNNNVSYYPTSPRYFDNDDAVSNYDLAPSGTDCWMTSYDAYTPFMNYLQFSLYSDKMYESKCFKNSPKGIVYPIYIGNKDAGSNQNKISSFATGCMVTPSNSIDLFQNKQDAADAFNPKTYINYREDLVSVSFFDKTIRRSNVIQDESRVNGWRTFSLESYKNITENKGKITNLYGIGTIFLVHTEHSLFMFDIDNTMKTENKSIQLFQPDTFDVDYKEVLTSDLGYGGLQDSNSWIADQFGYIFYNRDFNRFFIFDNGQLGNPDEEIIEFLYKYKPYKCIFANDKLSHRLLIKMTYLNNNVDNNIILSFNYDIKKFISQHLYDFNIAYNTKVNLFLQYNNNIYEPIKDDTSFSIFENKVPNAELDNPYFVNAKLSIIINTQYDLIKFIEFISYKLYKLTNNNITNFLSPVEERISPFSGVNLKVYNDQINTKDIPILIDNEISKNIFANYDKPYWDLGNWNFSYLRNRKDSTEETIIDDVSSRLYGNWFIVEMTINNDEHKVEFESLRVNLTKDKIV